MAGPLISAFVEPITTAAQVCAECLLVAAAGTFEQPGDAALSFDHKTEMAGTPRHLPGQRRCACHLA
jgi:hypothetical protein